MTGDDVVAIGQCVHCGDETNWLDDPAPDICHMCTVAGRWSPLWGPDKLAEYRAMVRRLYERGAMAKHADEAANGE